MTAYGRYRSFTTSSTSLLELCDAALEFLGVERPGLGDERARRVHLVPGVPQQDPAHASSPIGIRRDVATIPKYSHSGMTGIDVP